MDIIPILVHYGGLWDETFNFLNFKVKGALLRNNCTFEDMLQILSNVLNMKNLDSEGEIKYKINNGYPALVIEDDTSLLFYLELKKIDKDFTKYPLCVSFQSYLLENNISASLSEESNIQRTNTEIGIIVSDQQSSNLNILHAISDYIDYANFLSEKDAMESMENEGQEAGNQVIETNFMLNTGHDVIGEQKIQEGIHFKDKETLKNVMSFFAIKNHFQYKVTKSCSKEYSLNCLDNKCMWNLKASRKADTNIFIVRKFDNIHNCTLEIRLHGQRQTSAAIIGEIIKMKYLSIKTIYTPADIIRDMKEEYGITMTYQKAWRAKEKALEDIRGKPSESYSLLPSYMYMLKKMNPGSVGEIQTKEDSSFEYAFMALDASIKGWKYCRPVMVVDGTFLKSVYGGTLLTSSTQDASGKIFPLAFCVVDSENDASWEWFFSKVRQSFGMREGLSIISDRHESIRKAVDKVYPEAAHGICMFQLLNNLKTIFKKNASNIKEPFFAAAKSYTEGSFNYYMGELDKINQRIRPYLISVGYKKWARVHCKSNRYSALTSNLVESFNATAKAARELPIATMLEYLRGLTQQWSVKNRSIAASTYTKLSRQAELMLEVNTVHSLKLQVVEANGEIFSFQQNDKVYTIDLRKTTCTCGRFQVHEIPCSHAIAVLKHIYQDVYPYCSNYYAKETMAATYEATVYPLPAAKIWDIPDEVKEVIVLPPQGKIQPEDQRKEDIWDNQKSNNKINVEDVEIWDIIKKLVRISLKEIYKFHVIVFIDCYYNHILSQPFSIVRNL